MENFETFKKKQYISKAINATYWNVLGTILSFILGSLLLAAFSQSEKIINFIDRGDFCLYSAGLLSSSIFILSDNKENIKLWHNNILYPITFLLIIISAGLYCAIFISEDLLNKQSTFKLSDAFIRTVSCLLIFSAFIITYRSLIIDFHYRPPKIDVIKTQENSVNNIKDVLGG